MLVTSAAMQQIAIKGDRLYMVGQKQTSWRPSSREVYFFLSKDSRATTNDPNMIIRLSASYTVMASPPCQEMCRPPLRTDFPLLPYFIILSCCPSCLSPSFVPANLRQTGKPPVYFVPTDEFHAINRKNSSLSSRIQPIPAESEK